MVGVPGRSKGCNTCRQRRIACSLERPHCAQCIKSKRVCGGYQRKRIFVVNQGTPHGSSIVQTLKPASEGDSISPINHDGSSDQIILRNKDNRLSNAGSAPSSLSGAMPSHLMCRQQIFQAFFSCYVPFDTLAVSREGSKSEMSWIVESANLPERTRSLESSILAVCTNRLGRLSGDEALIRESLRLYGDGLWELQKALWDPVLVVHDDTLATCMTLLLFEIMECPGKNKHGWRSHSNGLARLVQLRGPEAHNSRMGHQLFRAYRINGITRAMDQHKSTFVSSPEWMEIPWKNEPKTLFDEILDIYADVSTVIDNGWSMEGLESKLLLPAMLKVIDSCWRVDEDLQKFYKKLEDQTPGPLYWPEFSRLDNAADDPVLGKVFPVAYHFLDLSTARLCMLYWTIVMILWSGCAFVYQLLAAIEFDVDDVVPKEYLSAKCLDDTGDDYFLSVNGGKPESILDGGTKKHLKKFDISRVRPLEHRKDSISYARNVCQSVEYCMQDEMQGLGPFLAIMPLGAVVDTLKNFPDARREFLWAIDTMKKLEGKGFRLLRYAWEMQTMDSVA